MSDNYGMLETGFKVKDLSVILKENLDLFKEFFGNDINTTAMNPLVKFNETVCVPIARLWLENGNFFDSHQVSNATGRFLDDLAIQMDLARKVAQNATTRLTFSKSAAGAVTIPAGTVVDNNSSTFLKEFLVDDDTVLPAVFVIQKGVAGGSDLLNGYPGFTDFFDIASVEWVSANFDGSAPYILATDYTVTVPVVFATAINWAPVGAEPATGSVYYVKVGAYRAYVDSTAKYAGRLYNAAVDEIYNMQSSVSGIIRVTNESAVNNGRDLESDLQLRRRMLNAGFALGNDAQMGAFLNQLHRIDAAKVYTMQNTGHFRSLIYPASTSNLVSIFNEAVYETELRKETGVLSVAIIPLTRGAGAGGIDVFPSPYSQTAGVSGVWKIDWVGYDPYGVTRYIPTTDYVAYTDYANQIDWSPGGAEPAATVVYWVKCVKCVEIAETFPVTINGRLVIKTGYDITTVNNELFLILNDYIKSIGINGILYQGEILRMIMSHPAVYYIDNLYLNVTMRLYKGAANGIDIVLINGSGRSDSADTDVIWINQLKDNTGTVYAAALWNWSINAVPGVRGIDWAPGGAEPTTGQPYWINTNVKGDILPPQDVIITLSGVSFTL